MSVEEGIIILSQTENNGSLEEMSNDGNNEDDPEFIFFTFILHGIITNTVGFIGLIGNVICILVLRRPQMRGNSTNVILSALSAFDAFLIVTSMLMLGFPAIGRYSDDVISHYYYTKMYPYIMPCVYAFGLVAQTGSIYCTLGVTVERYIVICWPLRSSNICTYGRAKMAVILIALFSLVYNIPRFFEVTWGTPPTLAENSTSLTSITDANSSHINNEGSPHLAYSNSSNAELSENVIPQPTALRMNGVYISVYVTWMYLVFIFVFPFGCLSVLNLLIYLDVRRSNARQSTLSQHEKKELRLAVMLMTVVVVFQICNIPPLIVNILEVIGLDDIPELTQTSNLLVTVNSSVNIFIYIILGDKFKRVFLQCLSENMSCCYGNDGFENNVCCPIITMGRKDRRHDGNGKNIPGTADFYMTDALVTQPTTKPSSSNHAGTTPRENSLHPTTSHIHHDTQSNNTASTISNELSVSPSMPNRSSTGKTDCYKSLDMNDEEKQPLVVALEDDQLQHPFAKGSAVKLTSLDDNEKCGIRDNSQIKDNSQMNKNNCDHSDAEVKNIKVVKTSVNSSHSVEGLNQGTSREKDLGSRALSITIAPNASSEALEVSCSGQVYPTKNDLFNEDTILKPSNYPDKGYAPKRRHFKSDEIDENPLGNIVNENTPFLQHTDSENSYLQNDPNPCSGSDLTSNVIAKVSDSPISISQKLRDV